MKILKNLSALAEECEPRKPNGVVTCVQSELRQGNVKYMRSLALTAEGLWMRRAGHAVLIPADELWALGVALAPELEAPAPPAAAADPTQG